MGNTKSSRILEPRRRQRSWSISQAASISSWIWDGKSSTGPRVTEGLPASSVFPWDTSPPLPPRLTPVLSGTPGYPQGAGSHGSAAQTLHKLPGSQPPEPRDREERGHRKAICLGNSFFSQLKNQFILVPLWTLHFPFPPWDNLLQRPKLCCLTLKPILPEGSTLV